MNGALIPRTVVVESKLAYQMRRSSAAFAEDIGLSIVTLPAMAARLAGGFLRPADEPLLVPPIRAALAEGGFEEFEAARSQPGMARAVLSALQRIWSAGIDLTLEAQTIPRFRDLLRIEERIRRSLPEGVLLPAQLLQEAIKRAEFAPRVLGPVHLHRFVEMDPIWRPLLRDLCDRVEVTWDALGSRDRRWFPGKISVAEDAIPRGLTCEVCADPRSEVVEALRWARQLLATGNVLASEVAIVAADPAPWDNHMVVLTSESDLPLHFANGVPALSTPEGQACAAVADVLLNGLSVERVLRLSRVSAYLSSRLPVNWAGSVSPDGNLMEVSQWEHALSLLVDDAKEQIASTLSPVVRLLAQGPKSAEASGELLLGGKAQGIWTDALRLAPAAALEITLGGLKLKDDRDPANTVVWTSCAQAIGAPRRFMRLIGLSAGSWPRANLEDPLLPDHLVDNHRLMPLSRLKADRIAFRILASHPGASIVASRSRRAANGSFLARSSLCTREFVEVSRLRTRIPEHAFSEADRLLANPVEAANDPRIASASQIWNEWSSGTVATPHDGIFRPNHPAVEAAISKVQSATALRQLLRDPLGFIWQRTVGMRMPDLDLQPLRMDASSFGELVHELLRLAVNSLEPEPGLVRAEPHEIDDALRWAVGQIQETWPLTRPTPPKVLWTDTIAEAKRRAERALTLDKKFGPGTKSFSEVPFGEPVSKVVDPWPGAQEVVLRGSGIRLRGRIDRIDIKADGRSARISDYKTGVVPAKQGGVVLGGGSEVQRALYAAAARQLLPEVSSVISRLVYLDTVETPFELKDAALEDAEATLDRFIGIAVQQLRRGFAHPGPDAYSQFNDFKIALPANLDGYRRRKSEDFEQKQRSLAELWNMP